MKKSPSPYPILLLLLLGFFCTLNSQAQNIYNIAVDDAANECEGILIDSNVGLEGEDFYDHDENYQFTLCIPDAISISITFSEFNTEIADDVLSIYEGENTSGNLLETYSGAATPPPLILLDTECITFTFISDLTVTADGWTLVWDAEIEPTPPLDELTIDNVPCFSNNFTIDLSSPVLCDAVNGDAFSLSGPDAPSINNATPINCDTNGFTTQIAINLNGQITQSGNYSALFDYVYVDLCEEEWQFTGTANFATLDCPIEVIITPENPTACDGNCVSITAEAAGGDLNYSYAWNPALSNNAEQEVCPGATAYSVTVTDGQGATASTNTVIQLATSPEAGEPITVCETDDAVPLNGSPSGGDWYWQNVDEEWETGNSWEPSGDYVGDNWIYYEYGECYDSLLITVLEGWAWWNQGACTGSAPFELGPPEPPGGTWSGPNVSPGGIFDPSTAGQFELTYEAPNGCSDTKIVYVDSISLSLPVNDTICESTPEFTLNFSPPGGWWNEHDGFENTWSGEFFPTEANAGVHTLTYNVLGCSQSIDIVITQIDVAEEGGDVIAVCPEQGIVTLPEGIPTGGTWMAVDPANTGLLSADGQYDTGWNGTDEYEDFIIYALGDCQDVLEVRGRYTRIFIDYFEFCPYDEGFQLNWGNVERRPGGGTWSGPGVVTPSSAGSPFDPVLAFEEAGAGAHTLYYTTNGCTDSMTMVIHEIDAGPDVYICEIASAFNLTDGVPTGGHWHGDGITDTLLGTFDPGIGLGTYEILYISPDTCMATRNVIVEPQVEAVFPAIEDYFCFRDTLVELIGTPLGGTFEGTGIVDNVFNPIWAGEGAYILTYHYGTGECASQDQFVVNVGGTLGIIAAADTSICPGGGAVLSATAYGGAGLNYEFTWNNDIGFGQYHLVEPETTTTYIVNISDGCTIETVDTMVVFVNEAIDYNLTTSEALCAGSEGFANISTNPSYEIKWSDGFADNSTNISATTGFYEATITDPQTQCYERISIEIPEYEPIYAEFSPNPNSNNCQAHFAYEMTDFSLGGVSGTWDFGDGTMLNYGETPQHTYTDLGNYTITLNIQNEGGCTASYSHDICIDFENDILVPNAFSPNGDGFNETFKATGLNITSYEMYVYNRWGQQVFFTNKIDQGWEGIFEGRKAPIGTYVYFVNYTVGEEEKAAQLKGNLLLIR